MEIKLELLEYQESAIKSVVNVFDGNTKNTFDNACKDGIRSNLCSLSEEELTTNIKSVFVENGVDEEIAKLTNEQELTIEMETGTGKTLVYVKSIYELFKQYGFTKFIILVPSVAIRQGVLSTLSTFKEQLEEIYGFTPKSFEYSSKKLNKVTNFIEEQHPQIMVMTLICLDVIIADETVEHFKTNIDQKLIVLERALDTTKKWNLKHAMGDKFNAF